VLDVATFRVNTFVVERFEVPTIFKFVPKIEEVLRVVALIESIFALDEVFIVDDKMKGIVNVSKLKTVLFVFDVKPAATMFVV
jgi:hypothetical protein